MRKTTTWGEAQDPTCAIRYCECGEQINLWISDHKIDRCPKCERGYITEFVIWTVEKDENKHP